MRRITVSRVRSPSTPVDVTCRRQLHLSPSVRSQRTAPGPKSYAWRAAPAKTQRFEMTSEKKSLPLFVLWLCMACHVNAHAQSDATRTDVAALRIEARTLEHGEGV